jgi:integrase
LDRPIPDWVEAAAPDPRHDGDNRPRRGPKRARSALSKVHLGIDPQTEKIEAMTQASVTLGAVIGDYLERRAEKRLKCRSFEEVRRHLQKLWEPLHEVPIQKIRRADVATRLAEIARENGPFAANRARASMSGRFNWCLGEGLIDAGPIIGTNKTSRKSPATGS